MFHFTRSFEINCAQSFLCNRGNRLAHGTLVFRQDVSASPITVYKELASHPSGSLSEGLEQRLMEPRQVFAHVPVVYLPTNFTIIIGSLTLTLPNITTSNKRPYYNMFVQFLMT